MLKKHITGVAPHILKKIKQLFSTQGLNVLHEGSEKQFKSY